MAGYDYTPVTLKFVCNVATDDTMIERESFVVLPRCHALMLAAAFMDGGSPEGHFSFDPSANPWLSDKASTELRGISEEAYGVDAAFVSNTADVEN